VRGVAMLAFVAAMLVVGLTILWITQWTGSRAASYLGHYYSSGAFYAAESGAEIAVRELKLGSDISGDGVVGRVSDDSNDANDPSITTGTFHVTSSSTLYTATGAWQGYTRVAQLTVQ
jgi:hypothetical protein